MKRLIQRLHNLCEKIKTSDCQWELMKRCERAMRKGVRMYEDRNYNQVQVGAHVVYEHLESSAYVVYVNPRKILTEIGIEFTVPVKIVLEGETEEPQ